LRTSTRRASSSRSASSRRIDSTLSSSSRRRRRAGRGGFGAGFGRRDHGRSRSRWGGNRLFQQGSQRRAGVVRHSDGCNNGRGGSRGVVQRRAFVTRGFGGGFGSRFGRGGFDRRHGPRHGRSRVFGRPFGRSRCRQVIAEQRSLFLGRDLGLGARLEPAVAAIRTLDIAPAFGDGVFRHFVLCIAIRARQPHSLSPKPEAQV
jgi:hypothetical protein